MTAGYVQAPADNAGKKADATELTVNAVTVERIRVAVPTGMKVSGDLLELLLLETRTTNDLLAQAFGLGKDLQLLRLRATED